VDTLTKDRRSALMKLVRQKHTAPELLVRSELHRRGLRFKVGDGALPGTPDLSFPRYKTIVFVHGCFWHGHSCRLGRPPSSNIEYWRLKIDSNRKRDARKEQLLSDLGWRVMVIWQCELRHNDSKVLFDKLAYSIREGRT
jgi:DNA mismatch endonuclease, patch repair protein